MPDYPLFYRRNLPHWQPDGSPIFLTWRLFGSLPPRLDISPESSSGARFLMLDKHLDRAATGPRWLERPKVAEIVLQAILRGAALRQYELHSFVLMPNHVHLLIVPHHPIRRITGSLKTASAVAANRILNRQGRSFWQDESFDHWVRSEREFARITSYILYNPVAAGLSVKPEDWPWSSASCGTGTLPVLLRPR